MESLRASAGKLGITAQPISVRELARRVATQAPVSLLQLIKSINEGAGLAYTFRLDQFEIHHTRARDKDTDVVSIAVKVDGKLIGSAIKRMGDVADGVHTVNLEIGPISVPKLTSELEFNFQILNSGHNNDEEIDKLLKEGGAALLAASFTPGTIWATAAAAAIALLTDLFKTDCDGPVAIDAIAFTGRTLNDLTLQTGTHRVPKFFLGTDAGKIICGDPSKYTVTWSVSRVTRDP